MGDAVTARVEAVRAFNRFWTREVGILGANTDASERRPLRTVKPVVREPDRALMGRAQRGRAVFGIEIRRLEFHFAHHP